MKIKEIVKKYGIDPFLFEQFIKEHGLTFGTSFSGLVVPDDLVEKYVYTFLANDIDLINSDINDVKKAAAEMKIRREKEIEQRIEEERLRQEAKEREKEEEKAIDEFERLRKNKAMANMLITSGFNFDGYRITKYSGYISGDDAMSVDRGMGFMGFATSNTKDGLMASLSRIRRNALRELKEAAYDLGCNAVIGVDFDYITLDPQTATLTGGTQFQPYVFCVTANGNAVVIEKIKD